MDEPVSTGPKKPVHGWTELDKLRGKEWAAEVLRQRRQLVDNLIRSEKRAAAVIAVAMVDVDSASGALQKFDETLRPRMSRRRARLLQFMPFTTDDGQITMREDAKVLDFDKTRKKELLAVLKSRRSRKPIRVVEDIDLDGLKSMSQWFIRSLPPHLMAYVGKMKYVGIKSTGEGKSTNLLKERPKKRRKK